MKRILLISYYFPPCGGAAVQRWMRLIPHLIHAGIGLTVICPRSGDYPNLDLSLLDKLPADVRIIRCGRVGISKTWARFFPKSKALPYGSLSSNEKDSWLRKAMIWIRLNLVIPDMRVLWLPAALKAAKQELRNDRYNAMITTGPPHSTHLAGLLIKRNPQLKWFTDFRDPWLDIHYLKANPPAAFAKAIHSYLERKVLASADENLIVSKYIAEHLPKGKKTVFYNGFEASQFKYLSYQAGERFRIKYIGQMTEGQNISALLNVFEILPSELKIELVFIGTKLEDTIINRLQQIPSITLVIKDFMNHQDALLEMVCTELLLLLINDYEGSEGMLTTKLFEYLGSRSPILLLGNSKGEAAELILKYEAGACFEYTQTDQATKYIQSLYHKENTSTEQRKQADLSEIEAETQAATLIDLI